MSALAPAVTAITAVAALFGIAMSGHLLEHARAAPAVEARSVSAPVLDAHADALCMADAELTRARSLIEATAQAEGALLLFARDEADAAVMRELTQEALRTALARPVEADCGALLKEAPE